MSEINKTSQRIPVRLQKDPILEALCEVRFESSGSNAGTLLPGLLYERLRSEYPSLERLPTADIPPQIRQSDPNLRFVAQHRLKGPGGMVQIGDHVLSVASVGAPYPGWVAFRESVRKAWDAAYGTGLISAVSRISIKVVNLLPGEAGAGISDITSVVLKIGLNQVSAQPTDIKTEIANGDHVTVVRIANPANVTMVSGETRVGLICDVDTVRVGPIPTPPSDLSGFFDLAHAEEKRVFFSLLGPATLESCEPIYD